MLDRPVVALNARLPADVHAQLKAIAAEESRTLNGQIVHALREWLAQRPKPRPLA